MPCTTSLCPHATWINGVGVNRASFSGRAGAVGMINANAPGVMKSAAYQFQALTTSFQISMPQVMRIGITGPFRRDAPCARPLRGSPHPLLH